MIRQTPVVIYDENTDRELRQTRRVVKDLDPTTRRSVARFFAGWHVQMEMDYEYLAPADCLLEGYCVGVAQMHSGTTSDVILLTNSADRDELAHLHAYPLATVRSIKTVAQRNNPEEGTS